MKKKTPPAHASPTDTLNSIFAARRDLLGGVKSVVKGSGFTIEEADLLVTLYGASTLNWDDLEHDQEGYVPYAALGDYLVHNPSLLSRRVRKLAALEPPLVEVAKAAVGQHHNALRVRITPEGVKRILPVWERYAKMAETFLRGIPQQQLDAHCRVNEEISTRCLKRRRGAKDFSVG